MKFAVALLALVAVSVNAAAVQKVANLKGFSYTSCSAAPEAIVINSFSVLPDPLIIPGECTYSISLTGTKAVVSPTAGVIIISYRVDSTAEYEDILTLQPDDVCTVLDRLFNGTCPQSFTDNGVPCQCPFEAKTYTITDGVLTFPNPLETLSAGDYKLHLSLSQAGEELQCYDFTITLQSPPA